MLVAQIWVSQQGQSLILSQHDPISSWLCLTLLYVDTNHWSLISQTQTSNSVGLGDRHCDGFSQPTETIEICPISHGHGMGNHQAGIPSAQGESPNLTVTVCWLMQRHNPWYSKHFTLSPSPCLSLKPCGTASEDQSIWPSGPHCCRSAGRTRPRWCTISAVSAVRRTWEVLIQGCLRARCLTSQPRQSSRYIHIVWRPKLYDQNVLILKT